MGAAQGCHFINAVCYWRYSQTANRNLVLGLGQLVNIQLCVFLRLCVSVEQPDFL